MGVAMDLLYFAWMGFMLGIGAIITISSFGEWGHIPVALILGWLGWVFVISKFI